MAFVLPTRWRYRLMRWGWPPQNRLVLRGLYFIAAALALLVPQVLTQWLGLPGSGTFRFCVIAFALIGLLCLGFAGMAWIRQKLLWRLRNRLIVTYVFIGVIPVALLVAMTGIAAYLFAGQFANLVVTSNINAELKNLETANLTVAHSLTNHLNRKDASNEILLDDLQTSTQGSMLHEICAWYGGKPLIVASAPVPCSLKAPDFLSAQFRELVIDHDTLYLRTGTTINAASGKLQVIASSPIDERLLDRVSGGLGRITIYPMLRRATTSDNGEHVWDTDYQHPLLTAGTLSDAANRLDREIYFGSHLSVLNWDNGAREIRALMKGQTRPSSLYERLFAALGGLAIGAENILLTITFLFAFTVLVALYVGARLDLTMTRSVANLYKATQHLNRGEFGYRIEVRERDQIAELQTSFNSMAASIEKLMMEQREKQRLENEITIAQEVQAQLFPQRASQLESLEVHGFCKPARTVSGDYYDFLPITASKLGLAVGDISGKGISAALLMATIHSAVRAYMLEGVPSPSAPVLVGGGNGATIGNGHFHGSKISPAALMYMLNRQLYSTTPMEKYATLFLALYDGSARRLTYTNAGHLPPILLGEDGTVRRLETGGTVVGLFDDVRYEESTVSLNAGEIFLAYSDGVTEPENDYGEFGEDRLIDLVSSNRHLPLDRISELVTNAVYEWIGANEQPDDVTLVLARAR